MKSSGHVPSISSVETTIAIVKSALSSVIRTRRSLNGRRDWTISVLSKIAVRILSETTNSQPEWHWVGYKGGRDRPERRLGSEWLFDLSWLVYSAKNSDTVIRFPLAVECEWCTNGEDLHADFLKLIVARAEVCVFIHRGKEQMNQPLITDLLNFRGCRTSTFLIARKVLDSFEYTRIEPDGSFSESSL